MKKISRTKVTRSSGNIFADIGLPDATEHDLKAHVVICISRTIEAKKLTQTEAAKRMGVAQPDLSKVLRGQFNGFSLERLLGFVRALGSDVEIRIKPPRNKHEGRLILTPA